MGSRIPIEPGTPDWWGRAAPQIERAMTDRPTRPTVLVRYANTAGLPAAADWPGGMAFNIALGVPVISDGAFWYPVSVGAHL